MTYSMSDALADNPNFISQTNIRSYLLSTITTTHTDLSANNGVIVNLDILRNLKKMENEIKIYMWIANEDTDDKILKVRGCASSTCSSISTDFSVEVGGSKSQNANKLIIQEISLIKNSDGTIKLTLNGDSTNAKNLWHDSANDKLWVQFTFVNSNKIKLSVFHVFISKIC